MPDDKFRKCNALKMFTLCDPIADISQSILTSTKKKLKGKADWLLQNKKYETNLLNFLLGGGGVACGI